MGSAQPMNLHYFSKIWTLVIRCTPGAHPPPPPKTNHCKVSFVTLLTNDVCGLFTQIFSWTGTGNRRIGFLYICPLHKRCLRRLCFHRCLSLQRRGLCLCPGSGGVSVQGGLCPAGSLSETPPPQYSSERTVRNLLECILVC